MDTYSEEGEQLLFMAPSQPKPLLGCVDNEMRDCTGNNLECAGQDNSNYVFSLDDGKLTMYIIWLLNSRTDRSIGNLENRLRLNVNCIILYCDN